MELAELGVVAPRKFHPASADPATALPRLRVVGRLIHDLGVMSRRGAALELLEAQREPSGVSAVSCGLASDH